MKRSYKTLISLTVVLLILITAGIIRSYNWPAVTIQEIKSEEIDNPERICIIGDLHSKNFSSLVNQIKEQKPYLILMAGDIFDASDTELDPTFKTIEELTDVCDVYFAMGNHELKLADKYPDFKTG